MQKTQETQFWSLSGDDPLEEEMATHFSSVSCLENAVGNGNWQATVHRVMKSRTQLNTHTP